MANLFDSTNYRTQEPTLKTYGHPIIAGDFLAWKREDLNSDYANTAYTLSYQARQSGSGTTVIALTASASGSDYVVEVASSTTRSYGVGTYYWDAYITKNSNSERIRIANGQWEIVGDKATDNADPRSSNQKIYEAVVAVIEGRASQDQMSYSIAGRSLSRMSVEDLIQFEGIYKARWMKEVNQSRIRDGLGTTNTIHARLPT
tara:strand:+ start:2390 stop:2998 length:609 start_codon:yes stop_codon:yes gene_type:complete